MVMDADAGQQQQQQQPPQMQPSPQSVGREFVRQYYTLLNKAPNHLHRFYNNSSSFVHGGLDSSNRDAVMVIGQKQIHNKIVQLNFRDCHAKISQVDSQATLGNGVVVQVTGELSNDGQPMRRFTQTFVLAAQSPKNYYVHNDIFRYQDYFSDDDLDENNVRSTAVEEDENDNQTVGGDQDAAVQTATAGNVLNNQQPPPQQQPQYYQQPVLSNSVNNNNTTNNGNGPALVSNYGQQPQQQMNGMMNMAEDQQLQQQLGGGSIVNNQPQQVQQPQQQQQQQQQPQQMAQLPQQHQMASNLITAQNQQQPIAANPPQTLSSSTYDAGIVKESSTGSVNNMNDDHQSYETNNNAKLSDSVDAFETAEEKVTTQPPQSNEPKTYANLVKSGGSGLSFAASIGSGGMMNNSGSVNRSAMSPPPMQKHQSNQQQSQQQHQQASSGPQHSSGGYQPDHRQRQHDGGRMDMGRGDGNGMRDDQRGLNRPQRGERRTSNTNSVNYGDSHQVFVGNIPHAATEDELRNLFGQFGQIVDLRILSKSAQKTPGQWAPPNYGFIIFEEQQAAADCLANTPVYYPDNNAQTGQKLNVEEKKTRPSGNDRDRDRRIGGSGGPGSMGGLGGMGNSTNNGPRSTGGDRSGPQSRNNDMSQSGSLNRVGTGQRTGGASGGNNNNNNGGGGRVGSGNGLGSNTNGGRTFRSGVPPSRGMGGGANNISSGSGGGGGGNSFGRR